MNALKGEKQLSKALLCIIKLYKDEIKDEYTLKYKVTEKKTDTVITFYIFLLDLLF